MVEAESFQRLKKGKKYSLKELLLASPHKDIELVVERDHLDTGREVEI